MAYIALKFRSSNRLSKKSSSHGIHSMYKRGVYYIKCMFRSIIILEPTESALLHFWYYHLILYRRKWLS